MCMRLVTVVCRQTWLRKPQIAAFHSFWTLSVAGRVVAEQGFSGSQRADEGQLGLLYHKGTGLIASMDF